MDGHGRQRSVRHGRSGHGSCGGSLAGGGGHHLKEAFDLEAPFALQDSEEEFLALSFQEWAGFQRGQEPTSQFSGPYRTKQVQRCPVRGQKALED